MVSFRKRKSKKKKELTKEKGRLANISLPPKNLDGWNEIVAKPDFPFVIDAS